MSVLTPSVPRQRWGTDLMRELLGVPREEELSLPDESPVPRTRPVDLARYAAGPTAETPTQSRPAKVLAFLWASLRGILSAPFAILTIPVLLIEGLVILVGTVLSYAHLGLAMCILALLPRPLARRAVFGLVPSVGSFWKIELLLERVINLGERLGVPQNLTDEPKYGPFVFGLRAVLGYVLYLPMRFFQVLAFTWAFGVEQTISMIRYVPGGLAFWISPKAFHPVTRTLWMPLLLGQYTAGLFADELEQGRPSTFGVRPM